MSEPIHSVDVADLPEPPRIRALRIMVTVLTATLIFGVLTIITLLVIKITQTGPAPLALPDQITLPQGQTAQAITKGRDWFAVVSHDSEANEFIYIFNPDGTIRQRMEISK